jgi:hypothetical protein
LAVIAQQCRRDLLYSEWGTDGKLAASSISFIVNLQKKKKEKKDYFYANIPSLNTRLDL